MSTADQINLVVAVAGVCSAAILLFVAIITYQIVKTSKATVDVMRAQLDSTTRPYVLVAAVVRPMTTFVSLAIRNTGTSSAPNLRLTLDKDFYFNAEHSQSDNPRTYTTFVHPIESLPPQAELMIHLGVGHKIFATSERCPWKFSIRAQYEYDGGSIDERNIIDL